MPDKPKRKWILPLIIGMSLPIVFAIFFVFRPHTDENDMYAGAARGIGVSRADYVQSWAVRNHADKKGELSGDEWAILQKNLTGKLRGQSLITMGYLGKSKHRAEAIGTLQPLLTGTNKDEEAVALIAWYDLQMPDWKAQCEARLNNPDSNIRLAAQKLIAKDARKQAQTKKNP